MLGGRNRTPASTAIPTQIPALRLGEAHCGALQGHSARKRESMSSFIELLQPDGRVLFLTNDFPPRRGGIETFVRQLCDTYNPGDVVVHASRARLVTPDYETRSLPFPVVRDRARCSCRHRRLLRRVRRTHSWPTLRPGVFGASAPLGPGAAASTRPGRPAGGADARPRSLVGCLPGTRALRRIVATRSTSRRMSASTEAPDRLRLVACGRQRVRRSPTVDARFHR